MVSITINGNIVDPAAQCEGGSQYEPTASKSKYVLLQAKHLLEPEEHAELERRNIKLQQYKAANTYICYYAPEDLSGIRDLDFIEYANVYHPDLVISDILKAKCDTRPRQSYSEQRISSEGLPAQASPDPASNATFTVLVRFHKSPERSASQIKQVLEEDLHLDSGKIAVEEDHLIISEIPASDIQSIALYDEVKSIEEVLYSKVHNHIARQDLEFVDYKSLDVSVDPADYDAQKIVVAVADTGFDKGSTTDEHPAFKLNRVTTIKMVNPFHPTLPNGADEWGHGTHVCGSVAGNHTAKQFGIIKGTAPGAEITMLAMAYTSPPAPITPPTIDQGGKLFTPTTQQFYQEALNTNAKIHSNSYGLGIIPVPPPPAKPTSYNQIGYDEQGAAEALDLFMRTHEESLIIFSAGNDGKEAKKTDTGATIGGMNSAKNCLTVGACETSKNMKADTYVFDDSGPDKGNRDNIAYFSSIGPTIDTIGGSTANGRIKPDVVAPGTVIFSTKSRFTPLKWEYDDKTHLPGNPDDSGKSPDPLYMFSSGTSMATPLVAGCAAVLRKILLKKVTPGSLVPAALIKALLVNGAVDMSESKQSHPPLLKSVPDNVQGFGRVNIRNSIRNITDYVHCGYLPLSTPIAPLALHASVSYPITIPKAPKDGFLATLQATMCYNDIEGSNELVNVLSLKVTQDQGTAGAPNPIIKYGNTQSTTADPLNNVQKVIWKQIHPGPATLTVTCEALKQPAIHPSQDYALVWSIDYVDPGMSTEMIALLTAVGVVAAAAIIAVIVSEKNNHH